MKNHKIYIIAAVDENFGIGKNKDLPWSFKKDMKHFLKITTQTIDKDKKNMVIMGKRTWESIPEKFRPLKGRVNVILARDKVINADGAKICNSIDDALNSADDTIENIFFIGGGTVYAQAMNLSNLSGVYLTHIDKKYECDTFFPKVPEKFKKVSLLGEEIENGVTLKYILYKND
jgi:dihydrofolate reductase